MTSKPKTEKIFDNYDIVAFLERNNVKYDAWLKNQFFKLVTELQIIAEGEVDKLRKTLLEKGSTEKRLKHSLKLYQERCKNARHKLIELEGRLTTIREILKLKLRANIPLEKQATYTWYLTGEEIGRLREASSSSEKLTPQEETDVSESLKEISEGKAKKFTDADAMIQDLKKERRGRKPQ